MSGPTAIMPAELAPRPRSWRRVVIVIAAVALACCAGGVTYSMVSSALSPEPESNAAGPSAHDNGTADPAARPGIQQPVRDGKFEFVVRSVTCGHASVGAEWFHAEAKGRFCLVDLRVSNIATEAQRFADGNQKAFGPKGDLYAVDSGAGVVVNGTGDAMWSVVNPGNALELTIVYDIPPTSTIVSLELHDSGFSNGVVVNVNATSPTAKT